MILATVGTQLPFPRLMSTLDTLAAELDEKIIAQTGPDDQTYSALDQQKSLEPADFSRLFREARVIVAHAGMGTILSARRWNKPLIILPRRHELGEHRNDHQMATARHVSALPGIHVAWSESDIGPFLRQANLAVADDTPGPTRAALIGRLQDFISH